MQRDAVEPSKKPQVLLIGLTPEQRSVIEVLLADCQVQEQPANARFLIDHLQTQNSIIVCGKPDGQTSYDEIVQLLRMLYQEQALFFVCDDRALFNRFRFIRNGGTDAFLLPIDAEIFKRGFADSLERVTNGEKKSFHPVKLVDIHPGSTLDFDLFIYLPVNDRYVHYLATRTALDEKRADQLRRHEVGTLYVRAQELQTFYAYAQKAEASEFGRAVTERKKLLKEKIRDLISRILFANENLSLGEGEKFANEIKIFVQDFIVAPDVTQWYLPLFNWSGEPYDLYGHLINVAIYSGVFSEGLGFPNVAEVATAGLLHGLGLATVPTETLGKSPEDLAGEEKKTYEQHPKSAVAILRNRRIELGGPVEKMILQHREAFNGSGYPFGAAGSEISWGAQIVGLIHIIDEEISAKAGAIKRTPLAIFQDLIHAASRDPGQQFFDPLLLKKMGSLFPKEITKNV